MDAALWRDLQLFAVAARCGTLTEAARELGLGQATLSRRLAALEHALGHRLFDRGPRGLSLTPAGEQALPHAQAMERSARGLRSALATLDAAPSGSLRVAIPPGAAELLLLPALPRLHAQYPELYVELLESARVVDLVAGQAELALRTAAPTHPELVGVQLWEGGVGVWAHPAFAASLSSPMPTRWVGWSVEFSHIRQARMLADLDPSPSWALRSNSLSVQIQAVDRGLGAMVVGDLIGRGMGWQRLQTLPGQEQAWAVFHHQLRGVPRLRAVLDFLRQEVARWQTETG
ncbi:MAG: LysR family transcriptional regulator [Myxococcota bacterium]|nr:LysR family transcriptional regulator [Myxococcota bacterium]